MARTSTIYRFEIKLDDVDRGVYVALAPRVACHPSETLAFMMTRLLAYCLEHQEDIAFGGGISTTEEPAVWTKHPDGRIAHWIDIGSPSADRLHRASKLADRVSVYTHKDPTLLCREAEKRGVHRGSEIPVHVFDGTFVDALVERIERSTRVELLRSDGHLYVTVGGHTLDAEMVVRPLVTTA
jgi:uncharacterized protein YaeQ